MAMSDLIIYAAQSSTFSESDKLPPPSNYTIDWEDLDLDSYRSVVNGNLVRNVLNRRWAKIGLSWRHLSDTEIQSLLSKVNTSSLWIKAKSPAFGSSGYITFKAYVSKMHVEAIEGVTFNDDLKGYNVSFNIVQERSANWQ